MNNPPQSGPYSGDSDYVEVVITTRIRGNFSGFVYSGPLENSVRSVSFCETGSSGAVGGGNAIISLNLSDRRSFSLTGSAGIGVLNGGIYVNSNNEKALTMTGSGSITADTIRIVGDWSMVGSGSITTMHAHIIGNNISVTGSGGILIAYDPSELFQIASPPSVSLMEQVRRSLYQTFNQIDTKPLVRNTERFCVPYTEFNYATLEHTRRALIFFDLSQ